jgi:hypothetical protein
MSDGSPSGDVLAFRDDPIALHAEVEDAVVAPDRRLDHVSRLQIAGSIRLHPHERLPPHALGKEGRDPLHHRRRDRQRAPRRRPGRDEVAGAPVFFYQGAERAIGSINVGPPVIKLAGVMMGTFIEGNPIREVETNPQALSIANVGIAAVTPSYFLHDILYSEKLRRLRAQVKD